MLLKSVIVSGITNLSDARYCSGMGVEFIGICPDTQSPNYLAVEKFEEINGWLSGARWILETTSEDVDQIIEHHETYRTACVLTASVQTAVVLLECGIKVILKVDDVQDVQNDLDLAGLVISFNVFSEGKNIPNLIQRKIAVYVSGKLTVQELEQVRDNELISGIVLSGGEEERPGFKNMDTLIDSLEVFED